ncbi:MAG: CysB family HTH-type transcriptional regulator [Betaproteobacteria bacterium]|nr:CysB family HTH-type transcriptional regulator [Betaproteobacteria bacterium]
MNLQQLRFVMEVVKHDYNLTEAAHALYTSQPGVSKAIIELEEELGIDIFVRHGKRLRKLTEPGKEVLKAVHTVMLEVQNLKRIGEEYARQDAGTLSIAATHTQARYFLPGPVAEFRKRFPNVSIRLHQGHPEEIGRMVDADVADVGVATEALASMPSLLALPCYSWQHLAVFPAGHPLGSVQSVTLDDLAKYPLVTYQQEFAGRKRIDQAFAAKRIVPQVVLEAIDSDVLKTYVELGMGVGLLAEIAINPPKDAGLATLPLGHLFGPNMARVAIKRGAYLRSFVYTFLELLSPKLTRKAVQEALSAEPPAKA